MPASDGGKPAPAGADDRLRSDDRLGSAIGQTHNGTISTAQVIRAELIDDDTCVANGITARGAAPALALCRLLVAAGYDPATRLEAYRASTLCVRVRSIAEGADLEPSPRVGFVRRPGVRGASPARQNRKRPTPQP